MQMKYAIRLVGLVLLTISAAISAEETYTFANPPRGSFKEESTLYNPFVNYLSEKTGVKIKFVHTSDWLTFRKGMRDDSYDIFFGGPHFASFLITYHGHRAVARFEETHTNVVIVRTGETRITKVSDLAGRQNCLFPAPNFGTLLFLNEFTNPVRQPAAITTNKWKDAYDGVVSGKCTAAVMPASSFEKFDKGHNAVRILHVLGKSPGQVITVGQRVPPQIIAKLKAALLDEEGCQQSCATVLAQYGSKRFVTANEKEFAGYAALLRNEFLIGDVIRQSEKTTNLTQN